VFYVIYTIITNIFDFCCHPFFNGCKQALVTMEFKIDTKEKFHAITIKEGEISANMTEELRAELGCFRRLDRCAAFDDRGFWRAQ